MLAARDQENLVHGHQQVAASKPLNQSTRSIQPKTPGNRYPKTPLKVPLHDENAPAGFGEKSGRGKGIENLATRKIGTTFDKNAFVTPMGRREFPPSANSYSLLTGPRTRAPLGMKTTNAKTKAFQASAGPAPEKDLENTQAPKTSARRPKKVVHADTVKLQIHGDESPLAEREVEYAPPKPRDLPYESEVFPDGCLNYDALKPENLLRGIHQTYNCSVDENGRTKLEREYEEGYLKAAKATDEQVLKMMEEDWTVGDVPETFRHLRNKPSFKSTVPAKKIASVPTKGPATIASRKAASALSVVPKPTTALSKTAKPVPNPVGFLRRSKQTAISTPSRSPEITSGSAAVASRSTIGYSKGRSAVNTLRRRESGMKRSVSNASQVSDTTITPARFAEQENDDWRRLDFLRAFDVDDEELEPGLRGALSACLKEENEDDEFVLTLSS
jgi:hypothetical protein